MFHEARFVRANLRISTFWGTLCQNVPSLFW